MRMTPRLLATATARIVSVADSNKRQQRFDTPVPGLPLVHGFPRP
ncbi:hypothetical protein BH11PSE14_BH11PSE14_00630 [soil metagenome]